MKNLFLTAVFLLSALFASAQVNQLAVENQFPGDEGAQKVFQVASEKQFAEKTSALRTTWLANRPQSNWFISIQGGGTGMISPEASEFNLTNPIQWFDAKTPTYWHPSVGASIGKWFSPVWGLRLNGLYGGVQGFFNGITEDDFVDGKVKPGKAADFSSVNYYQGTFDFMINLKNVFTAYNPKAFFNPVLYVGMGAVHTEGANGAFNLAEKVGMQLNFRLNRAFDLFLDGNGTLVPKNFDGHNRGLIANSDLLTNASLGFTYKFNFRSFIKAPLYDAAQIDALMREINELRNRPVPVCPPTTVCPPVVECPVQEVAAVTTVELTPVFFLIGSSVVRDNQLLSVTRAAEFLTSNPNAKLELASYADRKTGSPASNMALSKRRGQAVADVLVKKFGIDKKRLTLKAYGDTVQPYAENDLNRVTIFVK